MKQILGSLGVVLIWPGAFILLGVVSHIFLGEALSMSAAKSATMLA